MAKAANKRARKKPSRGARTPPSAAARPDAALAAADSPVAAGNLSLHELFARQTQTMLDRADLSDEQKQSILVAMSCPCCGAGGFSFTAKLRRER